jgi:EpsI family protein
MSGPSRRDFLMGGALLAAAGGALALTPRGRLVLMPEGVTLNDIVPSQFGDWAVVPSADIVLPKPREGSLSDRLYGDQLARVYQAPGLLPIILVMAYGPIQNDALQLHRPEVCYSAVGFSIENVHKATLDVARGLSLPVRDLVARAEGRVETITYWTRIGDDLPTSGTEQRIAKLRQQWDGYIADGILVRMSIPTPPSTEVVETMRAFARAMLKSVNPDVLPALIGRRFAGSSGSLA